MMPKEIRTMKINQTTIRLVRNEITKRNVDVIVSVDVPAFPSLIKDINEKRGKIIQNEIDKKGIIQTDSALLITPGNLPCKAIIHAIGPQNYQELDKLKETIQNVLKLATKNQFHTISIPPIGFGVVGYPGDRSTGTLLRHTIKFLKENKTSLELIEFCSSKDLVMQYFKSSFKNSQDRESSGFDP